MALSDFPQGKSKPKPYKMGDAMGLILLIQPLDGKLWRLRSDRWQGKEACPSAPIRTWAWVRRASAGDEARELIAFGKDPSRKKRREKVRALVHAGNSFAAIPKEYRDKRKRDSQTAWAPAIAFRGEHLLSLLSGSIAKFTIAEIEPADVLAAVRRIEGKGKPRAQKRTLQLADCVFRYAVATARLGSDPTRDLRGALTAPNVTHDGAVLGPVRVGELLRAIDATKGSRLPSLRCSPRRMCSFGPPNCDIPNEDRPRRGAMDDPGPQNQDAQGLPRPAFAPGHCDPDRDASPDLPQGLPIPFELIGFRKIWISSNPECD